MTVSAESAAIPVSQDVVAVSDNFVLLMRAFTRIRTQMLAASAHDVEWSAQMLLKCLALAGPLRSSALAERVQSDPSTVSRQVAALVQEGLVERRADPGDGRACLLVLTDKADDVLRHHDELKNQHFARMLADWNERDLRRFAGLLARFTEDFDNSNTQWLSETSHARRSAEGTN